VSDRYAPAGGSWTGCCWNEWAMQRADASAGERSFVDERSRRSAMPESRHSGLIPTRLCLTGEANMHGKMTIKEFWARWRARATVAGQGVSGCAAGRFEKSDFCIEPRGTTYTVGRLGQLTVARDELTQ
jgi:hypothetical protein